MMSKWMVILFLTSTCLVASEANAGKTVVHKGPRRTTVVHHNRHRTRVVVHKGFPIRRTLPAVIVRAPRTALIVATPRIYLAPVVFATAVIAAPAPDVLAWQDTDQFDKDDDWTEQTFPVGERGKRLVFRLEGRLQVSFAEVVFDNGDGQVVDFNDATLKNGTYELLDFKNGRRVSHVRMVARARSDSATASVFLVR